MKKKESYMELCIHIDGKDNVYLRIPIVWNDIEKQWKGFIKTPITQKLIYEEDKKSFDLQDSFNRKISSMMQENEE